MKEVTGKLDARGLKVAIVASRFNQAVTERLLQGAVDVLRRTGLRQEDLTVVRVPGSFEIPQAASRLARSGKVDAVICLGCLIRGETAHYDYLAMEVTRAIQQVALQQGIAVSYGVLTADTVEQAMNRAGLKYGNKGAEAALAAVELANAFKEL